MSGSAVVAAIALALSAIACGPTAPSRPVALTITISRDVLIVAETATLSASVRLSNGRTQIVTPLWTAEDAAIGRLSDAGTVIAVTPRTTTIAATYEGLMAAQRLRVVPDYGGAGRGAPVLRTAVARPRVFRAGVAFRWARFKAIYSFGADRILEIGDWLAPRSSPREDAVFLEKPPLKFWIVAAPIQLGLLPHNEFGIRFWDAL